MNWRDQLQPASFRGVAFHVDTSTGTVGRRNAVHEYPGQDLPWVEDMGRKAREFTLQAYVIGNDYRNQRNALLDAIEQRNTGTLIHPRFGALTVSVTDGCRWRESTRDGGFATFTLVLIESGEQQFPVTQSDSVAKVKTGVNQGLTALQIDLNKRFTVNDFPGWVAGAAKGWINQGFAVLTPFINTANNASQLTQTFNSVRANLDALISTPDNLVNQISQALSDLMDTRNTIDTPLAIRRQLSDELKAIDTIPLATPARQQQAANREAVIDLFTVAASLLAVQSVAEQSRAIAVRDNSDSPFDSFNQAIAVRDELLAALDTIIETADDALYMAIQTVKPALLRHIDAHGFQLARVVNYTPAVDLPALVIAHSLYSDATREADIVRRNNIRHPGFVLGGVALEVLSVEGLDKDLTHA